MSNENDRAQPSSIEYTGHQLVSYRDIVSNERETRARGEESSHSLVTQGALDSTELNEAEARIGSHLTANIALGVVGIVFLFCLIGNIPAVSCGLRFCNRVDKSSSARVFAFAAPLAHVWGAFTTGVGGILAACVHLFFLRTLSLGSGATLLTTIRMRKGVRSYLLLEYIIELAVSLLIFLFIGFSVSWLTAASFLLGILLAKYTAWLCLYIATYGGLCIVSAAENTFRDTVLAMFRSATTIGVLSISIAISGVALAYIIFQNIRSLLGLAAGVSSIALISRVSSGIYSAASKTAATTMQRIQLDIPVDDPRNYAVASARIGDNIDGATGVGVEFVESMISSIVVSAISATSLPYVSSNPYVLCVYNNLHIDFGCIAYGNTTQSGLLAAEICRLNRYHSRFPSLAFSQSNSAFIAVPFFIALLSVLIAAVCSIRFVPLNTDQPHNRVDMNSRIRKAVRIQSVIAASLFIIGSVSISFGLFGPQSSFQNALSTRAFPRSEFSTSKVPDKCVPFQSTAGSATSNVPQLNNTFGGYRATNEFGESFPLPDQIPGRLLAVLILGQFLGFVLEGLAVFFCDSVFIPTSTVAKMGECGIEDVISQGLGSALISTILPFMLTLSTALASHVLLGTYGITLLSVSMLAASSVTFLIGIFETLAKNSVGISELNRLPFEVLSKIDMLGRVGGHFSLTSRSVFASSSLLVVISLVSDLIQVSELVPTGKDVIGLLGVQSRRHIRSIDGLTAIDPNVVVSVIVGTLLPMLFIGLPLLGMTRTAYAIIVEARSEIRQPPDSANDDASVGLQEHVKFSARYTIFETLLPVAVVLLTPLSIGFGLGQRAQVAFLLSISSCSYLLSMLFMTTGNSWCNACRAVKERMSDGNREAHLFRLRAVTVAEDIGYFLSRTTTPGLIVFMKLITLLSVFSTTLMKPDNSLWYIGVAILAFIIVLSVVILTMSYKHQKKIRTRARVLLNNQTTRAERLEGVPEDSSARISPFYEDGVLVTRRNEALNETTVISAARKEHLH